MSRIRLGAGGVSNARDITTTNVFTSGYVLKVANAAGSLEWAAAGSGGGGGGPANTDGLSEGSTNLYFTAARARSAFSAASNAIVSYDSSTGILSTNSTNLASAVTSGISAGTGLTESTSGGVKTITLSIPDDVITHDMLKTGIVEAVNLDSGIWATLAEAESGTSTNTIMTPQRTRQAANDSIRDLILNGYTHSTSGSIGTGQYRVDTQNGRVTINPSSGDSAKIADLDATGTNLEIRDGAAYLRGTISTTGTDANSNLTFQLTSPWDNAGTLAGGEILFERFMAHKIRHTEPAEGIVGTKALKITGTNSSAAFVKGAGSDGLAFVSDVDTDDISEGSTNLFWTGGRFDSAFSGKDTDDLSEGSTNQYFTQARARGAVSAASGAIVGFTQSTGVIDTSTANLATAMKGILGSGGSNVSITQSGNSIIVAATVSGGGGGGASTLSALTDTNIPNTITAGRPLIWDSTDSKWEPGLLNGGQLSNASMPITKLSGISANGTDGQLVAVDGSGGAKLVSATGIGVDTFTTSTAALTDSDYVLLGDGDELVKMTKRNWDSQSRPVHLRTDIQESGYVYKSSGSPAQSHVRLFDSGGNVIVGIVAKTGFELELNEILQQGFLVQIRNADSSKFRYGLVSGRSGTGAGNFWLATLDGSFLDSQGTFANDEALIFESFGQFAEIASYANQATAEAGVAFDKWMSPRATRQHAVAYQRDNEPAQQYEAEVASQLVLGSDSIVASGDWKITTADRKWRARLSTSQWTALDPLMRKGASFQVIDDSNSSVQQSGSVESVDRTIANSGSDRVVEFVYASGGTNSISDTTEIDSATFRFTAPQAGANRDWVLGHLKAGTGITRSTAANGDVTISAASSIEKASVAEMRAGEDDAKYATALGVKAAIDNARDSNLPEASLTGISLVGSGSISAANQAKLNTGNFFNMRLTAARYREIEDLLVADTRVRLISSDGTVRMNTTMSRAEEFDESASTDDLVINLASAGGLQLTDTFSNLTLNLRASWADDWDEAVDGFLTANLSAANSSVVVTHATGTGHGVTIGIGTITAPLLSGIDSSSAGALTISSDGTFGTATAGGGGNVTYATQGTANAGTSTNTVMSPATTHGVVEHLAHVASYTGFTHATSGNDMGAGTWWINSAGTQLRARGHDAAETQRMLNEFLIDRDCIMERSGARLDFGFTDVTAVSQGSNSVVQATITNHQATPANPTLTGTDWVIRVLPEQNRQVLEHAPAGSIPHIALARDDHSYLHVAQRADRNQFPSNTTFNVFPRNSASGVNPLGDASHMEFEPHTASSKFQLRVFGKPGWLGRGYTLDVHLRIQRIAQNDDGTWPSWSTDSPSGSNTQTLVRTDFSAEWRGLESAVPYLWEYIYTPSGSWTTANQRLRCELRRGQGTGAARSFTSSLDGTSPNQNMGTLAGQLNSNPSNSNAATSLTPFVFTATEFI